MEERLEKELLRAEALALEADRHKEIADIASEQTLAMNHQVCMPLPSVRLRRRQAGA